MYDVRKYPQLPFFFEPACTRLGAVLLEEATGIQLPPDAHAHVAPGLVVVEIWETRQPCLDLGLACPRCGGTGSVGVGDPFQGRSDRRDPTATDLSRAVQAALVDLDVQKVPTRRPVAYLSLHSGWPTRQDDHEATYARYARVLMTAESWKPTAKGYSNQSLIYLPECRERSEYLITHVGLGSEPTGPGELYFEFSLSAGLVVTAGITPAFSPGALMLHFE